MSVNVNFKRGLHQNLIDLASGAGYVDGTFYLTTDTHRLYVCQDGALVDLNQYIHIANGINTAQPPKKSDSGYNNLMQGDIYYWADQNILAICDNPTTGEWTQLNPDTYLAASNQNLTFTNGSNAVTVASTVADSKNNQSKGSFSIAGGTNITVSQSGGVITIASTDTNDNATYELGTTSSVSTGIISLGGTGTGATSTSVTLTGGGSVAVSSDAAGNITISGTGGLSAMSTTYNAAGGFQINYTTTDGSTSTSAITPIISYGENNATTAAFASGTAALDVYTKTEVDDLITASEAAANAMTYKGTVSSTSHSEIATTANVGDTYKAEDSFTIAGIGAINAGDLLIAKGTDGNVTWDLVPSGDDQTITGGASGNGIWVTDQSGSQAVPSIAGIVVDGSSGSYGTISVANNISGNKNTLTVSHGAAGSGTAYTFPAVTTATTQDYSANNATLSIPIITAISKDDAGHVTSVSGATYSFTDSHANLDSLTVSSAAVNNIASITITAKDTDDVTKQATFRIKSDNLEVTSASANNVYEVTANLVWGTF